MRQWSLDTAVRFRSASTRLRGSSMSLLLAGAGVTKTRTPSVRDPVVSPLPPGQQPEPHQASNEQTQTRNNACPLITREPRAACRVSTELSRDGGVINKKRVKKCRHATGVTLIPMGITLAPRPRPSSIRHRMTPQCTMCGPGGVGPLVANLHGALSAVSRTPISSVSSALTASSRLD